ncbi:MAG: hypothetical protein JXA14_26265 [Anaerolineae bacterium]|nr:hypothetical protein [Anaerolineae bacterium]
MEATIYARVPTELKAAVQNEAHERLLSLSDIVREALIEHYKNQAQAAGIDPTAVARDLAGEN